MWDIRLTAFLMLFCYSDRIYLVRCTDFMMEVRLRSDGVEHSRRQRMPASVWCNLPAELDWFCFCSAGWAGRPGWFPPIVLCNSVRGSTMDLLYKGHAGYEIVSEPLHCGGNPELVWFQSKPTAGWEENFNGFVCLFIRNRLCHHILLHGSGKLAHAPCRPGWETRSRLQR